MNPFLFIFSLIALLLLPISVNSQVGAVYSDPVHPLRLLSETPGQERSLQISYASPYGIASLADFGIAYYQPVKRGVIIADLNWLGLTGYYKYHIGLGYAIVPGKSFMAGLSLHAEILPGLDPGHRRIIPGSSIFTCFNYREMIITRLRLDNLTAMFASPGFPLREALFSASTRLTARDDINIICGLSYAKGRSPLFRAGISILAMTKHEIAAGMQSGPAGFWVAYRLSLIKLDFLFTIQTSGVFGYEPGTSLKFFLD